MKSSLMDGKDTDTELTWLWGLQGDMSQSQSATWKDKTKILRCWYLALNERTRILRGLKKKNTMQLVAEGWAVHYNFFKHPAILNGKTPAEIAGSTSIP